MNTVKEVQKEICTFKYVKNTKRNIHINIGTKPMKLSLSKQILTQNRTRKDIYNTTDNIKNKLQENYEDEIERNINILQNTLQVKDIEYLQQKKQEEEYIKDLEENNPYLFASNPYLRQFGFFFLSSIGIAGIVFTYIWYTRKRYNKNEIRTMNRIELNELENISINNSKMFEKIIIDAGLQGMSIFLIY